MSAVPEIGPGGPPPDPVPGSGATRGMRRRPLGASLVVYLAVSFATPRTSETILSVWTRRLSGEETPTPVGTLARARAR